MYTLDMDWLSVCCFSFTGENKAINFIINDLDIESHINCDKDNLTVSISALLSNQVW